jgi:hypothetical protein
MSVKDRCTSWQGTHLVMHTGTGQGREQQETTYEYVN